MEMDIEVLDCWCFFGVMMTTVVLLYQLAASTTALRLRPQAAGTKFKLKRPWEARHLGVLVASRPEVHQQQADISQSTSPPLIASRPHHQQGHNQLNCEYRLNEASHDTAHQITNAAASTPATASWGPFRTSPSQNPAIDPTAADILLCIRLHPPPFHRAGVRSEVLHWASV